MRFPLIAHINLVIVLLVSSELTTRVCQAQLGPPPALPTQQNSEELLEPPPAPLLAAESADLNPQQQFRQHVERGLQLSALGEWKQAVDEYRAAYKINPRPNLLFNIAQAFRKGTQWQDALSNYERFISDDPKSPLVPEAQAQIGAMRAILKAEQMTTERERVEREAAERAKEAERLGRENAQLQRIERETRLSLQALRKQPLYKKPWFWGVTASAVVVVGVGIGLGIGLSPRDPETQGGFFDVNLSALR